MHAMHRCNYRTSYHQGEETTEGATAGSTDWKRATELAARVHQISWK